MQAAVAARCSRQDRRAAGAVWRWTEG